MGEWRFRGPGEESTDPINKESQGDAMGIEERIARVPAGHMHITEEYVLMGPSAFWLQREAASCSRDFGLLFLHFLNILSDCIDGCSCTCLGGNISDGNTFSILVYIFEGDGIGVAIFKYVSNDKSGLAL